MPKIEYKFKQKATIEFLNIKLHVKYYYLHFGHFVLYLIPNQCRLNGNNYSHSTYLTLINT